jgi:BirA family transcriptional regulator, biotin operon repressor / biotin---[acetyl-CoA-carboxylase] ligase
MQSQTELIRTLADGHFHSGETLGLLLGVSRAAVWKRLRQLKNEYGLEVDAVKGRGYRLREPLDLLNVSVVQGHLSQQGVTTPVPLRLHLAIPSTNSWLMQQATAGAVSGTVCLAEYQTAGKGRHGRQWVSPFGRNIYLSLLWRFDLTPTQLAGLSLASAIGVLRALRELNCVGAGLKWPNDILWEQRKLAGLLLEVSGEAGGPSQVVIGVGLNTWLGDEGREIGQPWVDLSSIPNMVRFSRNQLAAVLIRQLRKVAECYEQEGLAGFIDEWHRYDLLIGRQVEVRSANHYQRGEHLGIAPSGALRLSVDGVERQFHAGEVSLRPGVE